MSIHPEADKSSTGSARYDIVYVPLGAQAYGGAERSIMDLATRFAARGRRVLLLVGPELAKTDFLDETARRGLETRLVHWTHRRSRLHNLREAIRTWKGLAPTLVHFNISWHPDMWLVALCARLFTRAKLIGSMRAMPDPHDLVPRRRYFGIIPGLQLWHLPELAVGWTWGRVLHRTVTVNARDFSARLVEHYGYPAERIAVIYNGVDVNVPPVGDEAARTLRQQAGIADDDFLIAMVGRLSEEKGGHLLLQAIAPLEQRVRLVLVGDGPQRPQLEALADRFALWERVLFAGYTPAPEGWMAAADLVAVPSTWYEAFGRVVIEAMQQGTPVVASRIGGMAELFVDGLQGRYVESGDAAHLGRVISELAADRAALEEMGRQGRRLVRERYSLERVEADYADEYASLSLDNRTDPRLPPRVVD